MATSVHHADLNRFVLHLSGADSHRFQQGEEYNSIISVQVTGGSLALSVDGNELFPLRVFNSAEVLGCKAPNLIFRLTAGTATVIIDRIKRQY